MKTLRHVLAFAFLLGPALHATPITVGTANTGNCGPFMCSNDSGENPPVWVDYEEAYVSSAFPGPTTISSISYAGFFHPNIVLGGNYAFSWGYSSNGLNLSSNLASNYSGSPNFLATFTIPAGGINFGSDLNFYGFTPFTYDPANGDLLLEIYVTNQDHVPNTGLNGYNAADLNTTEITRAFNTSEGVNQGAGLGALVTTFNISSFVPEPSSLLLVGTGIAGCLSLIRKRRA